MFVLYEQFREEFSASLQFIVLARIIVHQTSTAKVSQTIQALIVHHSL